MHWHAGAAEGLGHNKKGPVLNQPGEHFPQFREAAQCRAQKWVFLLLVLPSGPSSASVTSSDDSLFLASRIPRIKHRTQTAPPSFLTFFSFCPNGFLVCSYLEFSPAFLFSFFDVMLTTHPFQERTFAFVRSEWCLKRHAGFVNKLTLVYFQQDCVLTMRNIFKSSHFGKLLRWFTQV